MTDFYQLVQDFHQKFGQSRSWSAMNAATWDLRKKLVVEEAREFAEAMDAGDVESAIKEACDLLYVTFGFFVTLGMRPDDFFREIQYSNMSKVDGSGNPVLRDDGKVLKEGTRYYKPSLRHILSREVVDFVSNGFKALTISD